MGPLMFISFTSKKANTLYICILLFTVSFASFNFNFLKAADTDWYQLLLLDSDQLVLEGVLRGEGTLGRYWREDVGDNPKYLFKFFEDKNTVGDFKEYRSSFGAQVPLFNFLYSIGLDSYKTYYAIIAFMTSLCVVSLFLFLEKYLTRESAFIGVFSLVISPWFINFSKSVFFIPALWLFPMIITFAYIEMQSRGKRFSYFIYSCAIFFAFVLKMLTGYEYVTTMAVASCVPFFMAIKSYKKSHLYALRKSLNNALIFIMAIATSFILHSYHISQDGKVLTDELYTIVSKRVSLRDSNEVVKELCGEASNCLRFEESLTTPAYKVVARYFVMPTFVPWLGAGYAEGLPCSSEPGCLVKLSSSINEGPVVAAKFFTSVVFSEDAARWIISRFSFLFYFILVLFFSVKYLDSRLRLALLISFFAPVSWFVLASPHSYIHTHMNYVLWYIPFIPISLAFVVYAIQSNIKNNIKE